MADDQTPPAIITLTTDFGDGSRYVAAMKGVILSINPHGADRRSVAQRSAAGHPRRGDRAGRNGAAVSRRIRFTWRWSIRAWAPSGGSCTPASARSNSSPRTTAC